MAILLFCYCRESSPYMSHFRFIRPLFSLTLTWSLLPTNQSYQRFVPLSLRKVRLRGFSMFVLLPGIQQSSPLTVFSPFLPPPFKKKSFRIIHPHLAQSSLNIKWSRVLWRFISDPVHFALLRWKKEKKEKKRRMYLLWVYVPCIYMQARWEPP